MKKLFAMLLALVMCLALCVPAFAEGETTPTDQQTVTIEKVYKLANAGTTSPAETFTLVQTDKEVVDSEATEAPDLGTITGATFASGAATTEGAKANITITLPTYNKVGVYKYTLKEVAGTVAEGATSPTPTAGVNYFANDIILIVTVVNGDNGKLRIAGVHTQGYGDGTTKSSSFENTFSAGNLQVTKTVTGNLGDKDKYFEFKVTLTGEDGKNYADSYVVSGGASTNATSIVLGTETTFQLKHGETLTIANLPYGVSYKVEETAVTGYTTTKTGDEGSISNAVQTAAFTNDKQQGIDMGVTLESLPYVLALVIVAGGAVVMFARKRRAED